MAERIGRSATMHTPCPGPIPQNLLYYARRYDEAVQELQRALEVEPSHSTTHLFLGAVYLEKQ